MTELQWPAWVVGRHTIPQLLCLREMTAAEKGAITSLEGYQALLDAERRKEREWVSS